MSDVLSPVSFSAAASGPRDSPRDGPVGVLSVRPQAAEGANALRPVDPVLAARKLRVDTTRDQPVGPPPAFKINVLQDLRERMLSAPEAVPDPADGSSDPGSDATDGAMSEDASRVPRARPDPAAPQPHAYQTTPDTRSPDHILNLKV